MFSSLKKLHTDTLISIFLLLFLSFLWYVNKDVPPNASLYPKVIIIFSYLFTILLFIKSITNKNKQEMKEKTNNYKFIVFITIITFLYIVLIEFIGYGISTVLFMVILLWMLNIRSKIVLILVPLTTTITLYFVFNHLLMVLLPEGYLFSR